MANPEHRLNELKLMFDTVDFETLYDIFQSKGQDVQ